MFYLRSCKFHSKFQTHLSITIEENPSPRRYNKKKPPDEKHKNCKVVKLYDTALHQLSYTLKHIGRQENMLFLCESSYVQSEMWHWLLYPGFSFVECCIYQDYKTTLFISTITQILRTQLFYASQDMYDAKYDCCTQGPTYYK